MRDVVRCQECRAVIPADGEHDCPNPNPTIYATETSQSARGAVDIAFVEGRQRAAEQKYSDGVVGQSLRDIPLLIAEIEDLRNRLAGAERKLLEMAALVQASDDDLNEGLDLADAVQDQVAGLEAERDAAQREAQALREACGSAKWVLMNRQNRDASRWEQLASAAEQDIDAALAGTARGGSTPAPSHPVGPTNEADVPLGYIGTHT